MVKISDSILFCKSLPDFYWKELNYLKRNTVRLIESLQKDGYDLRDLKM